MVYAPSTKKVRKKGGTTLSVFLKGKVQAGGVKFDQKSRIFPS
jgi:hypothetical protein